MFGIEQKMARTAKKAGFLTGGLLLCSVGAGFLTVAAWLALGPIVGLQMTALIVALCYLGVGIVLIGIAASSSAEPKATHAPTEASQGETPPIMQAFMYGLQAGSQSAQTRH